MYVLVVDVELDTLWTYCTGSLEGRQGTTSTSHDPATPVEVGSFPFLGLERRSNTGVPCRG